MTNQPQPAAPPGWYPEGVNGLRYWDGSGWTEQRAPAAQPRPRNSEATAAIVFMLITLALALSFFGLILAWVTAIVGLVCGISGLRYSARVFGVGKARSVWAIAICGAGLFLGVISLISSIVNH